MIEKSSAGGQTDFLSAVDAGLSNALEKAAAKSDNSGQRQEALTVALSGGPDSTALLSALATLRDRGGLPVFACHVNHRLRGAESDADEEFCRSLAKAFRVPLDVRLVEPVAPVQTSEDTLRQARYELLISSAEHFDTRYIATGHTLDDQAETILFRLFRGTGPKGMLGMEPARLIAPGICLLRPILKVPRSSCQHYLSALGQAAVQDSSNDNQAYTRNYIRHRLIPLIKERFPGFEQRMDQLRTLVGLDEELLSKLTSDAFSSLSHSTGCNDNRWRRDEFKALPESLRRRVLALALSLKGVEVSFERVGDLLAITTLNPGGAITLNEVWDFRVDNRMIYWLDKQALARTVPGRPGNEINVKIPGLSIFPTAGKALRVEVWAPDKSGEICFPTASASVCLVDLAAANPPLVLRERQPGDLIRPFGMDELVKLKKFIQTHKQSETLESSPASRLVLADREEVIWVPGLGLSNKVKVTGKPSHRLELLDLAPDNLMVC